MLLSFFIPKVKAKTKAQNASNNINNIDISIDIDIETSVRSPFHQQTLSLVWTLSIPVIVSPFVNVVDELLSVYSI